MGDLVKTEARDAVLIITIDRPEKMNALSAEVIEDLGAAIAEARSSSARCVILTGAGKAFVAGADIAAMAEYAPSQAEAFSRAGQAVFAALEALPCPVIAAVNGYALGGGCELAMACDFLYASSKAKLGQPEVGLGVIPGFGGTQRLTRRVGIGVARELNYTGRIIGADEALRIGLVNAVFEPGELLDAALKTAALIAKQGPKAVAEVKATINAGASLPLEEACSLEAQAFGRCFATADQKEGMAAFMAKRKPEFTGS